METYFKVLGEDGISPYHGGSGKWNVPVGKRPGKWMPKIKNIKQCSRGYHFVKGEHLMRWIGPSLYVVEVRGKVLYSGDKGVAEQARLVYRVKAWNDKTLRLFAADCAERALSTYESKYPDDMRPRNAIQAARDFAKGKIGGDQLRASANAASAAANAAYAYADAASAASAAERKWQTCRLFQYLNIEGLSA